MVWTSQCRVKVNFQVTCMLDVDIWQVNVGSSQVLGNVHPLVVFKWSFNHVQLQRHKPKKKIHGCAYRSDSSMNLNIYTAYQWVFTVHNNCFACNVFDWTSVAICYQCLSIKKVNWRLITTNRFFLSTLFFSFFVFVWRWWVILLFFLLLFLLCFVLFFCFWFLYGKKSILHFIET